MVGEILFHTFLSVPLQPLRGLQLCDLARCSERLHTPGLEYADITVITGIESYIKLTSLVLQKKNRRRVYFMPSSIYQLHLLNFYIHSMKWEIMILIIMYLKSMLVNVP